MLRELAQRSSDGLTVTLQWDADDDVVVLHVDDHGRTAVAQVKSDRALDAFWHPFCYLTVAAPAPADELATVELDDDDRLDQVTA